MVVNIVKNLLYVLPFAVLAASACGRTIPSDVADTPAVRTDAFGSLNGATLELRETGGFAALETDYRVNHDTRAFVMVRRHICSSASNCGAPLDSASGTLSGGAADSLFTLVWAASPSSLADDYGATRGGADMVTYALQTTFEGRRKSTQADDGTMPPAMRRMVEGIHGVVAAASR
jgi:hypothetical protein